MRCAAGVSGIKEKGKTQIKKGGVKKKGMGSRGEVSERAAPGSQGRGTPPAPRPAEPVNSSLRGCPAPGAGAGVGEGSADPQKFAARVPRGERKAG